MTRRWQPGCPPAGDGDPLAVTASVAALLRIRMGIESVTDAVTDGRVRFAPDDPVRVERFLERFALPVGQPRPGEDR